MSEVNVKTEGMGQGNSGESAHQSPVSNRKKKLVIPGQCPHGMAQSSCPICGAGGGASTQRISFAAAKMSYSVGMSFLVQLTEKKNALNNVYQQILLESTIQKDKLQNSLQNTVSAFSNISGQVNQFNMRQNLLSIINNIKNLGQNLKQKLDVKGLLDKLAAIMGEQMEAMKKNAERFKEKVKQDFKYIVCLIEGLFKEKKDQKEEKKEDDDEDKNKKKEKISRRFA